MKKSIINKNNISLLLLFLSIIIETRTQQNAIFSTLKQKYLFGKLQNIQHSIKNAQYELSSLNYQKHFKPDFQRQDKLTDLKIKNKYGKQLDMNNKIYSMLSPYRLQNIKQSQQENLQIRQKCKISYQHNHPSIAQEQISYHFVSSISGIYLFINSHQQKSLKIYSYKCELLATIQDFEVNFILEEDNSKGNFDFNFGSKQKTQNQHDLVYAISSKNQLVCLDLIEISKKSKQKSMNNNKLYKVLNSKLILPNQNLSIVGVISKSLQGNKNVKQSKGSSYKEKQFFIAYNSSQIRVFDQMGTLKITMKEPSLIQDLYQEYREDLDLKQHDDNCSIQQIGRNNAVQFVDHHPYPLLLQKNWIYYVDTSKYSKQVWQCPYIPGIKKLFVQTLHSPQIYILTETKIHKIGTRSKDGKNHNRKGSCEIQKSIDYIDLNIKNKSIKQMVFHVHKNLIYLENLIYNMTSDQFLTVESDQLDMVHQKNTQKRCDEFRLYSKSIAYNRLKKSPSQKLTSILFKCSSKQQNSFSFYLIAITKSQSSLLIYIAAGFILVIFFALKLFKSNSNYQKQLLFPVNMDGQNDQIRRQHSQQLKKYMQQAKQIQLQEELNKKINSKKQKKK